MTAYERAGVEVDVDWVLPLPGVILIVRGRGLRVRNVYQCAEETAMADGDVYRLWTSCEGWDEVAEDVV